MYKHKYRTLPVLHCVNVYEKLLSCIGTSLIKRVGPPGVYLLDFFCSGIQFYVPLSPYLCFISFLYLDLYVLGDDAWIS